MNVAAAVLAVTMLGAPAGAPGQALRASVAAEPPLVVPDAPRPPAAFTLEWDAPPGCGSAVAIEARVQALLSGPPRGEGVAEVRAAVERSRDGVRLELTTLFEGARDVRTMRAATCADLEEATAVLLAVALEPALGGDVEGTTRPRTPSRQADPGNTQQVPGTPAEPWPTEPSRPQDAVVVLPVPAAVDRRAGSRQPPPTRADDPPRPPTTAPGRVQLSAGLGAGVEYGALQVATGAVRLSLGMRGDAWATEVVGTYLTPRRITAEGVGGRYQLGAAGLRGCWRGRARPLSAEACGGVEAGGLRVDSEGLSPATRATGPFIGPSASLAGAWALSRVEVTMRAEAVGRAWGSRTRAGGEVLLEQRPVSLRLLAGVRMTFFGARVRTSS